MVNPETITPADQPDLTQPIDYAPFEVREAFEMLRREINVKLETFFSSFSKSIGAHSARLDDHDRKFTSVENSLRDVRNIIHTLQSDVYRACDALSAQGLVIERVDKNTDRILELLQPKAVI